jgi:hypothetical protein
VARVEDVQIFLKDPVLTSYGHFPEWQVMETKQVFKMLVISQNLKQ